MIRRIASILGIVWALVVLHAPAVRAAGGVEPPPFTPVITNPAITAIILMDPHMAAGDAVPCGVPNNPPCPGSGILTIPLANDVTPPTSKQATIYLRQGAITAQMSFKVVPSFKLFRGCDPDLTNTRFLFVASNQANLTDWTPPFVLGALFLPFGITLSPTVVPAITQINSVQCLIDPHNPGPINNGGDGLPSQPGWLLMNVTIQFLIPHK